MFVLVRLVHPTEGNREVLLTRVPSIGEKVTSRDGCSWMVSSVEHTEVVPEIPTFGGDLVARSSPPTQGVGLPIRAICDVIQL